jgi:hypothetical protein
MLSVNFYCNISSYDILAYITKNYNALIYYAKIVVVKATIVHLIGLACPLYTKSGETYNGLWAMCYQENCVQLSGLDEIP